MDDHLRVLQQRVQPGAVGRDQARDNGEGRRGDYQQKNEEELDARQDGRGECGETNIDAVPHPQDETVGAEQKGPEQQRTFLPAPQCGKFVSRIQRPVAVRGNVGDGEVVGEGSPHQRKGRAAQGDEARDAGAAGGLAQPIPLGLRNPRNAEAAGGLTPQGDATNQQVVGGEDERQEEAETPEFRHGMNLHHSFILSDISQGMCVTYVTVETAHASQ